VKKLVGAVAAAVALGLVGGACSSGGSSTSASSTTTPEDDAAIVNGVGIKRADFEADMQDYVHNKLFVDSGQAGDEAAATGTPSVDFVRKTLQADILFELVRQEVAKRKLTLRSTDDGYVRSQTIARFDKSGSPDIFDAFPIRFQTRALGQTANRLTLQDALGGGPVTAAAVRATYDADPRRFGQICVRHILLLTEADAKQVLTEVQQSGDFAATASKETEDRTTASTGGAIRNPDGSCPTAAQLDPDFAKAALAAPPGQPAGPVQTKIGWHILRVDDVKVLPFEQVQSAAAVAAEKAVADKAAPLLNQFLQSGVAGSIHVDAKYGVWDPANHQVLPPGFRPETRPTESSAPSTSGA
jgi:parvulin-like peptidyl-prolyl isomerase